MIPQMLRKNIGKEKMKKLLIITGPTASGKTAAAVEAAKKLNGEVVSCDSMQIYAGMDIGTAKPTKEETDGIPHHMIGCVDPRSSYSCADFAADARKIIDDIFERGKLPILCGGTGLYIDSVLGTNVYSPQIPDGIKGSLDGLPKEELYAKLKECDPEAAEKTHPNNVRRVIRALEIYLGTGVTKTEWDRRSKEQEAPYDAVICVLSYRDRKKLYDRIDRRVDLMLRDGLLDEVKTLDLPRDCNAAQAIGYKELYAYLDGKCDFSDAVEAIKQGSRNYAKRQETWMKRYENAVRYYRDEQNFEYIVNNIAKKMSEV